METGDIIEGSLHVVDQAVLGVAKDFRFTIEEVKEYYDQCGDMDRTRNRFRRMREVLAKLPDDDPMIIPVPVPQQAVAPASTPTVQSLVSMPSTSTPIQLTDAPQTSAGSQPVPTMPVV